MYLKRKFKIKIHETERIRGKVEIEVDLNYELQVTAASLSTIMKYRHCNCQTASTRAVLAQLSLALHARETKELTKGRRFRNGTISTNRSQILHQAHLLKTRQDNEIRHYECSKHYQPINA